MTAELHDTLRVGVVSDTHGLMRPDALDRLAGVDAILHAGDVGRAEVLEALEALAPVHVVRGNVDHGRWADGLPETLVVRMAGVAIFMLHDRSRIACDPVAEGFSVVISGHTHRPLMERVEGVLWLNPGSIGPRRFSLPVAMAMMELNGGRVDAHAVELAAAD